MGGRSGPGERGSCHVYGNLYTTFFVPSTADTGRIDPCVLLKRFLSFIKGQLSSPLAVGRPRCHVSASGSRHRCWDWCCPSRPAAVQVWRRGALHRLTSKLSFQSTFPGAVLSGHQNLLLDWSCLASMSRALLSRHADFTRGCDNAEEAASRHPRPPSNPPASVLGVVEDGKGQHL